MAKQQARGRGGTAGRGRGRGGARGGGRGAGGGGGQRGGEQVLHTAKGDFKFTRVTDGLYIEHLWGQARHASKPPRGRDRGVVREALTVSRAPRRILATLGSQARASPPLPRG